MLKLYMDCTAISLNNKGVGRYSYELCKRVAEKLGETWEIDAFVYEEQIPETLKHTQRVNLITIPRMNDFHHNIWWLPQHLKKRKYNVLLKPMESTGVNYNTPTITVCHDIQELIDKASKLKLNPHQKISHYLKKKFKSINLQNSDVVICNSKFTRDVSADWYKFDKRKSLIGYCGVDERFFITAKEFTHKIRNQNFNLENFILTFATGDARENYDLIPKILNGIRTRGCDAKLVIAGIWENSDYIHPLDTKFKELNLKNGLDYQYIGFLGEDRFDDLIELYTTADFYLELSAHEGFGMQLAEGMACGTTCISSGKTALAEVGAGFDIRYPSFEPDQIAETIATSYKNRLHKRNNHEQINFVRENYSWDNVANLVAEQIIFLNKKTKSI